MLVRIPLKSSCDSVSGVLNMRTEELTFFGSPVCSGGEITLIGIRGPVVIKDNHLEFHARDAEVLNLGEGGEVRFVALGNDHGRPESEKAPPKMPQTEMDRIGDLPQEHDHRFLKACERERLPERVIELARRLLGMVRQYSDDILIEGNNRKWYTKPKNFLAITIQNTKRRLCIQVKDTKLLDSLTAVEVHRDKRYVRIFLENEAQLQDVMKAVRASYDYG